MLRALALVLILAPQDGLNQKIEKILQRLSADDIDARESAVRDLSALGPEALPLLKARAGSLEGETRGRVEEACRRIERERNRSVVLPPLRLVTIDAKDKPAKEVFEDIARQAGVEIDFGGSAPETLVTLSLKDAPPFRAFDEACRKAGDLSFEPLRSRSEQDPDEELNGALGQEASKGARMLVQIGAAPEYPTAFVRHYRVRVTQITVTRLMDFRQNRSTAHLQLDLQWLPGVSPLALSRFNVEEALDDQGRSLLPEKVEERPAFVRRMRGSHFGHRSASFPHTLTLPVPPADAKRIATLRGTASVSFPGESRALVFEKPLEGGKTLELNGLKTTLKDVRTADGVLTVNIEVSGRFASARALAGDLDDGAPFSHEDIQAVTESGKRLRSRGMSGRGDGQTMTWTLRYTLPAGDAVKEIRIPCVLDRFEDELKFEIRDIPLPR